MTLRALYMSQVYTHRLLYEIKIVSKIFAVVPVVDHALSETFIKAFSKLCAICENWYASTQFQDEDNRQKGTILESE